MRRKQVKQAFQAETLLFYGDNLYGTFLTSVCCDNPNDQLDSHGSTRMAVVRLLQRIELIYHEGEINTLNTRLLK